MSDELDIDWYMTASEAEIDAEKRKLDTQLAEMQARIDRLPIARQIAYYRRRHLEDILENRRRLRDPQLNTIDIITQMWRDGLRRNQIGLVKLRAWRATGIEPGRG